MTLILIVLLTLSLFKINLIHSCSSFYCINSCGSSLTNRGYKLILANNRDENIYRLTQNASLWPNQQRFSKSFVYGPLDLQNGAPPSYYSTWLGINNKGNIGNLLFFMVQGTNSTETKPKNRGIIVSNFLLNETIDSEEYLEKLIQEKNQFGPYNYIQLVPSKSGEYLLYYLNNNDTNKYTKINNETEKQFIFGISNSDLARPFQKVTNGKMIFRNIIDNFSLDSNKNNLIQSIIGLLQNKTDNMPDENLANFMQTNNQEQISGISRLNANYTTFWKNSATRTSTLILIDYENNVEYYEFNMTSISNWQMNKFNFKLNSANRIQLLNFEKILISTVILIRFIFFF